MDNTNSKDYSDTFLSRVFGLHSVYNQLQDNYHYYDPEAQYQNEVHGSSMHPIANEENSIGMRPYYATSKNEPANETRSNYLNSESDSELSSSASSPSSPILPYTYEEDAIHLIDDSDMQNSKGPGQGEHISWDIRQSMHSDNYDDTDSPAIVEPMKQPSKGILNKFKNSGSKGLPLYNTGISQSFRRSAGDQKISPHTEYQKRNFGSKRKFVIPPKERALYLWANITNMDEFLADVYSYYRGKGLLNIVLSRVVDLLILVFILGFTVFLRWGVDYSYFLTEPDQNSAFTRVTLSDIIKSNFLFNIPLGVKIILFGFFCYIVLKVVQIYFDLRYKLKEIKNFYYELLEVSDNELMTISWTVIVERLMLLKDYNSLTASRSNISNKFLSDLNSKVRLNAHDIANRIMRKENYMIALINKNVLHLSVDLPFLGRLNLLNEETVLTKTLDWNLRLCIINFVFNQHGQIDQNILKDFNRNKMADDLNSRFKMAAIINLVLSPFIVIYFVLLYFYRYFNEYKSNPSSLLGLRQYTPWAEWKLREFNELPHFFVKRLHLSIGPANVYINQFPRGFLAVNVMNFINFIAGAITAILVIMGFWFDNEEHNFWSFEITENKSTLFYISILGTIWAITSNSFGSTRPDTLENANAQTSSFFYDPEASLRYVSQFTHYLPSTWNGKLHTVEVKNEFCKLYSLKIILILNEILSLILTPFILWFKVSQDSSAIIDFFREYSIHVDGVGYVCYFAMFNFEEKDKNMMKQSLNIKRRNKKTKISKVNSKHDFIELDKNPHNKPKISDSESSGEESLDEMQDKYRQDDKMIKSYMYFLESYGKAPSKKFAKTKSPAALVDQEDPSDVSRNSKHANVMSNFSPLSNSIAEFSYSVPSETLNDDTANIGKKSGMLGMLNQFYKQDRNR